MIRLSSEAISVNNLPKSAETLWKEYVVLNGQSAITPGEIPEQDTYIISVNFVKVCVNGQTTRVFNVRKLCKSYNQMIAFKHEIERLLCVPNNETYHDVDKPRNLAKCVSVE